MRRWAHVAGTIALALVLGCGGLPDQPVELPAMPSVGAAVPLPVDPARQFDFWLGEWDVKNKHLGRSGEWFDSGQAVARIQSVAGGTAVLERWTGEIKGDPLIGFSLRAWDPELGKWVIYLNWHGGQPGGFFVMHGEQSGERIELFPPGDKTQTRYTFSQAHEGSCQWDEASSKDDGKTWVTSWVMQFSRTADPQSVDASDAQIELPPERAAKFEETRALDYLLGIWEGKARRLREDDSWEEGTAWARVTSMIEGFGLLQFLDTSWGNSTLTALGYETWSEGWVAVQASSETTGLRRFAGQLAAGSSSFTAEAAGEDRLRESWRRESETRYRWRREVATADGSWTTVLEVDFMKAGPQ